MAAAGISAFIGSLVFGFADNIKKVSKRKATSHMAVMSIAVLFLATFTLGIIYFIKMSNL